MNWHRHREDGQDEGSLVKTENSEPASMADTFSPTPTPIPSILPTYYEPAGLMHHTASISVATPLDMEWTAGRAIERTDGVDLRVNGRWAAQEQMGQLPFHVTRTWNNLIR